LQLNKEISADFNGWSEKSKHSMQSPDRNGNLPLTSPAEGKQQPTLTFSAAQVLLSKHASKCKHVVRKGMIGK
jgi:hypothetical protein